VRFFWSDRRFSDVSTGLGTDTFAPPAPNEAGVLVLALRAALDGYERDRSPRSLDAAFAAAGHAVAVLRGEHADEPPEVAEIDDLFEQLPDYERLVEVAVAETERSVVAAGARLWAWFGLSTPAPRWNEGERSRARLLVACACAPLDGRVATWLGPRLLSLAADRWATLLVQELRSSEEELWRRVLGERYESVWRRCAPRGRWRMRELADLVASDDAVAGALERRLSRWLAAGASLAGLPAEIEAAFVQSRTPARLA
jgi:hypothetical protein